MNVKDLHGSWIKIKFCRSKSKLVKKLGGVYALTNYEGTILYIGKSVNIQRRFIEHLDTPNKNTLTSKGRAFWFYYQKCDKNSEHVVERGLLLSSILATGDLPPLNKCYAPG